MGEPKVNSNNPFSGIGMRRDSNDVDRLNEIAGNDRIEGGVKYIDGKAHNKMGKDELSKRIGSSTI